MRHYKRLYAKQGWTPKRREQQALRIRQYKPWLKSTGPRTIEGKQKSCRNAYCPSLHTPEIKAIFSYLDASRLLLKTLARKRKKVEEAQKAARRAAKHNVLHITCDAPLPSLHNCPPLEGGRLRASAKGAPVEAGGVTTLSPPHSESHSLFAPPHSPRRSRSGFKST